MAGMQMVRVDGAKKMRRELKQAGADMSDLSQPYREAAITVGRAARPATPKGPTGRLARSVRASGSRTAATIRAGSATVPYANPIHWGWHTRQVHPFGNPNVLVPAPIRTQPWVSLAAQRTEPTWLQRFVEHMNDVLDQIKGLSR